MERVISFCGLFAIIGMAWLMSSRRRQISWRILVGGLALQLILAGVLLGTAPGQWLFAGTNWFFEQLQSFVAEGTGFLFGVDAEVDADSRSLQLLSSFAFGVLPTIVFFSSLMSLLYYVGIMQWIVRGMAWTMQRTLQVSGAESLSAAANIFVGHTEAPLVIRPYIAAMTQSELNAVMVGGFATISGGMLSAYASMGISPGHLVTAAIISAPAALLIAKVMEPEVGQPQTMGHVRMEVTKKAVNAIEAVAIGATDGMKLAMNIAAMLIAFLALIALFDALIGWGGVLFGFVDAAGDPTLSLAKLLGYAFAPIAWLMGIESRDCLAAGQLLGLKTVANEFIAYERLGQWIQPESEVQLSDRSIKILTYALSGFSNFGAIGIQIGGIGGIAPDRRSDLARLGLRAMVGGVLACCMTACIAGALT
jgi:CNT family concentrative nucleoside transporter